VSSNDVKQDALDNLADALTEDILNTPDDELLREVEEDYGDPRALANKFDQILERAEKQVFETARPAASPQVQSSVLDLPYRLREWFSTLFGGGPGRGRTPFPATAMVWAAPAAVLIVLILAPAVYLSMSRQFAALEKEQLARSEQLAAQEKELLARSEQLAEQLAELLAKSDVPPVQALVRANPMGPTAPRGGLPQPAQPPAEQLAAPSAPVAVAPTLIKLSVQEIAALVAGGRQLMVAGDIPNARLVLQQAAEAGSAAAALELGATYDPTFLQPAMADMGDVRMARLWYEKAEHLGSTEAAVRLYWRSDWSVPGR
jgi:hypothetical protein